jgi:hypothetical protein
MVNGRFTRACNAALMALPVKLRVQRKVFRIEQMVGGGALAAASDDSVQPVVAEELREPAEPGQELVRELAAIQSVILRNMRELSALVHDGNDRRMARVAGELGAAVESMETATHSRLGRGRRRLRTCSRLCIE